MQDIFSSQTNYVINDKNKSDGIELMKNLKDETIKLCVFDPQYRGILDQLHYGDEGKSRNVDRCALPQMTEEKIVEFLTEISRVLKPSGHIFLWVDRFHLCEGSAHKWRKGLPLEVVDMITWDKMKIGMGYRSRHKAEYMVVLQKKPIRAKGCWNDHGIPDVWQEKVVKVHPHSKPIELQKRLILATTDEQDFVLDPCAGGYSVLTCCKDTNRNFIGCDLINDK